VAETAEPVPRDTASIASAVPDCTARSAAAARVVVAVRAQPPKVFTNSAADELAAEFAST
jgi:hypothetical protein